MKLKNRIWRIAAMGTLALAQLGCNLLAIADARSQGAVLVTVQPAEPTLELVPSAPTAYPEVPDEVVVQFLAASQEDPALMVQYLSPQRQQTLPDEGPLALLDIDAPIEGYMIRSAAVSPDPPGAEIVVDLSAGGEEISRKFTLFQSGGFWFIDQIEEVP